MKPSKFIIRHLCAALFLAVIVIPVESQSITGDWYGSISVQGISLRINLHVTRSENGYSSTWDSPD
ncbi:MAG: hypothetical protein WBJ37_01465 [Bacteroidales bacterium]